MTHGPSVNRSDGGTEMPGDAMLLQAAYDVLTVAGNTYGWDYMVDRAHQDLGMLLARIAVHGSFYPQGSPGDQAQRDSAAR